MSVRKRNWTTPKGEAKEAWVVDYVDGTGKRRLKTFAKKKLADSFAASSKVEVAQGVHVADGETITVAEAGKLWIRSGEDAGLEATTIDQRRQHLDLHIVPLIGPTKLNKVTVPFARNFQEQLRAAGRSPAMIRRVTTSFGSILSDAQGRGLVIRNAVHEMARSRAGVVSGKQERRKKSRLAVGVDIPTTEEVRRIIAATEGRWRALIVTAVFTGMRASELRGLRWSSVDLAGGLVHVSERADRYNTMGAPKSEAGQRTIPLSPMVINTLKEWKLACPKGDLGLVFPTGAGNIEGHANIVDRGFKPAQLRAGVAVDTGKKDEDGNPIMAAKYSGLHALRHWFASWCINRKSEGGLELNQKQVQERLGHGSIAVTLDVYAHLFPTVDERSALAEAERKMFGNAT